MKMKYLFRRNKKICVYTPKSKLQDPFNHDIIIGYSVYHSVYQRPPYGDHVKIIYRNTPGNRDSVNTYIPFFLKKFKYIFSYESKARNIKELIEEYPEIVYEHLL